MQPKTVRHQVILHFQRPPGRVGVVLLQIRILLDRLVVHFHAVPVGLQLRGDRFRYRRLARAYVAFEYYHAKLLSVNISYG